MNNRFYGKKNWESKKPILVTKTKHYKKHKK